MHHSILPQDFIEEVHLAEQTRSAGKLSLLAYEAEGFSWSLPALDLIIEARSKLKASELVKPLQTSHHILFTGHMIDKAGRKISRFPASKEGAVRGSIKEKLTEIRSNADAGHSLTGIAGGACGGDILFLEVCEEMGIPAQMYLTLPRKKFLAESVAFAGHEWIDRFDRLFKNLQHPVLSDSEELPGWLKKKQDYNIWVRNNLWMLYSVLVNGGTNMTLLALWDRKGGDGAGGTEHMVKIAKEKGAKVIMIDIFKI